MHPSSVPSNVWRSVDVRRKMGWNTLPGSDSRFFVLQYAEDFIGSLHSWWCNVLYALIQRLACPGRVDFSILKSAYTVEA